MRKMRAISPVIATIIIVAVAVALAIAVVGWIMGLWSGFTGTETLQIYPDSYIDAANGVLYLHLKNSGGGTAEIYKVVVSGVDQPAVNNTDTTVRLAPGEEGTLTITLNGVTISAGTAYQVVLYTKAGNSYPTTVWAK